MTHCMFAMAVGMLVSASFVALLAFGVAAALTTAAVLVVVPLTLGRVIARLDVDPATIALCAIGAIMLANLWLMGHLASSPGAIAPNHASPIHRAPVTSTRP